jgi:conjugal transfer pilus assembly protein TraK
MRNLIAGSLLTLLASHSFGLTTLAVHDNSDVALNLSLSNYNRLVVKNDKIVEAVFPETAMSIKRDEQDGSVYVMLTQVASPFTLFLTTEAGHHFSVTVTGEEGLGKTVEVVVPKTVIAPSLAKHTPSKSPQITQDPHQNAMLEIIKHMERKEPMPGMAVSHPFGVAERMGAGLTLIPKEVWTGEGVQASRLEVYNGGNKPLNLLPEWFESKDVTAMKLSQPILKPHETAILYRVREVAHG